MKLLGLIFLVTSVIGGQASPNTEPRIVDAKVTAPTPAQEIRVALAPGIGKKASPLEGLKWLKGNPVKIEPGKAYLVEFWATWCPPCRENIPHLTELQKLHADKVTIIAVSNEKTETVKKFVEQMQDQMGYHVAVDTEGKVTSNYSQAYNQQAIPHGFIIDQKGTIVWYGHPTDGMDYVLAQVAAGTFDPVAHARQKAEIETLNKQLTEWFNEYFAKAQAEGTSDQTDRIAAAFIEKAHPEALLALAWNILIKQKDERSLVVALKAAEKANTLTGAKEPMVLDTYATALFENGKLNEAVAAEQKAMELSAANPQMQDVFKKRLLDFKNQMYIKSSRGKPAAGQ